jgi:hypothetical protein
MAFVLAFLLAAPDAVGLGSGRDGSVVAAAGPNVLNRYAAITEDASGSQVFVSAPSAFAAGDLVMVWQVAGFDTPPSGSQGTLDVRGAQVGRFEFARVRSVGPTWILLDAPLTSSYARATAQVIRVAELDALTVPLDAQITAPAWNGATGGVVALLVRGTFVLQGAIDVSGTGFQGGVSTTSSNANASNEIRGCTALDGPPDISSTGLAGTTSQNSGGGANKGEGIARGAADGQGNVANAGGGGNCHNAGGGGGGGAGLGGNGKSWAGDDRETGGLGGAPIQRDPRDQLIMGGGGGAGEVNNDFPPRMEGAPGGGAIWVRAGSLFGQGVVRADGGSKVPRAPLVNDGEGGGGAGGAISLQVLAPSACPALISAVGGQGGSTFTDHGPGGGGGGGSVYVSFVGSSCAAEIRGGFGGTDLNPVTRQATNGGAGEVTIEAVPYGAGFAPTFASDGLCGETLDSPLSVSVYARSGLSVSVFSDGETLCEGEIDPNGTLSCSLALHPGRYELTAQGNDSGGFKTPLSASCVFDVAPECTVDFGKTGNACPSAKPLCVNGLCAVCGRGAGYCEPEVKRYAVRGFGCASTDVSGWVWLLGIGLVGSSLHRRRRS